VTLRALVVPLVLLLATPATAALEDLDEFQAGVTLYTELEFEQALLRFQRVAADSSLGDEERAQTFLWIAMCYGGLSDGDGAQGALTDAKRLDPDAPLPQFAAPRIKEMWAATPAPEPQPEPEPAPVLADPAPPAPAAAEEPSGGMPVGMIAAAAKGGIAALLVVAGGVVGALAGVTLAEANTLADDPSTYQKDVVERVDLATVEGGVAAGLGAAGLAAGVAAVALFLFLPSE
jgi:hypothetical protein